MSLSLASPPRRRRLSLTPMIDVVFLLLVFFMLAARFGAEGSITLATAGGAEAYEGPPRLVRIAPDGLSLNGRPMGLTALQEALAQLTETPGEPILIQAADVPLQALTDVISDLSAAGFSNLVLVE